METQAEYTAQDDDAPLFPGFVPPTENWSKLPHALIEALPIIETAGEMKVILYILRHTWGYHDTEKKITLDEFCNGRKRRDGTRLDSGTGLSKPTVIDGLERAIIHGFITLKSDKSDLGRVKNFYSLAQVEVKEFDTTGKESCHRTEKDTSRNKPKEKEKEPPLADSPFGPLDDVPIGGKPPYPTEQEEREIAETEALFKPLETAPQETVEQGKVRRCDKFGTDPLEIARVTEEARAEQTLRTDPGEDGDLWLDRPVREFCALIITPYENVPDSRRRLWANDIREIVDDAQTGDSPDDVGKAIRSIATCDAYDWLRTCNRPTHAGFASALLSVLWGQALPSGGNGRHDAARGVEQRAQYIDNGDNPLGVRVLDADEESAVMQALEEGRLDEYIASMPSL